jgi:hypothetical protein
MPDFIDKCLGVVGAFRRFFRMGPSRIRMIIREEVATSRKGALERAFFATRKGGLYQPQDDED